VESVLVVERLLYVELAPVGELFLGQLVSQFAYRLVQREGEDAEEPLVPSRC
jgi:hypothetical protein